MRSGVVQVPGRPQEMAPVVQGRRLGRIAELDGLRALAIMAVMGLHLQVPYLRGGYLGVDIFFVLSGFLITALLEAEFQRSSTVNFRVFFFRRTLRLFPALVVLLLFCSLVAVFQGALVPVDRLLVVIPAVLFYASNWVQAAGSPDQFGVLQHTWSLAIEEQFYLVWPFAFLAMRRRMSIRTINRFLVVVVALSAISLALSWQGGATPSAYYRTDTRMGALLVGAILALTFMNNGSLGASSRRQLQWVGVGGLISLLGLLSLLDIGQYTALAFHVGISASWLLAGLVLAILVWAPPKPISWLFASAPVRMVAAVSYPLYLWHPVVIRLMEPHLDVRFSVRLLVLTAASFAVAAASHLLVEKPFLRLRRYVNHPEPESPARWATLGSEATRLC